MKRIKKSNTKTVAFRVPIELADKWKAESVEKNISLSDVVWSELMDKKGITPEQERFLVKSYLMVNRIADYMLDFDESVDERVVAVSKLWFQINDEFEELMVSLFGDDIVYSPKKKFDNQDEVYKSINPLFDDLKGLYE